MTDTRRAPVLLADIGGTNARFMLAGAGMLPEPRVFKTADYASLGAALANFLGPSPPMLGGAAFSVAGPVEDGQVRMTNCPWVISTAAIQAATGVAAPVLLNDFAALGHGIAAVKPADLHRIGGGGQIDAARGPIGVLGPGTGLGVGALIPNGRDGFVTLSGEGGHVDLAPANARELEILAHLMKRFGHVSAERVLSGPGLVVLYEALAQIQGEQPLHLTAAGIDAAASLQRDPRACEAIALFTGWLGAFAGNLALTLGAKGGILLAGGILPRWGALFDATLFRARFEAKGRFQSYLAGIPTAIIVAPDIAFRGLYQLANNGTF